MRIIQQPSIATLKPARDESSDFDKTENLFIEGDNLEVLKLLQKSYFGKVKMIYIDPPYNTGKEFIYPDKYAETLDTYLKYTGQKDSEGRKFSTNTETTGRYHSNWLNMMYPRLYLAHNLLRDDGVIFISIDDNEQANLKLLCDEIFGEDNFVETFIWKKKGGAGNTESYIGDLVEYIVMYTKNISDLTLNRRLIEGVDYPHKDSEGIYRLEPLTKTDSGTYQRNTMKFSVTNPNNKQEVFPPEGRRWIVGKNTMNDLLEAGLLIFMLDTNGNFNIKKKDYYNNMDPRNGVYLNLLVEKGSLKTAKDELGKLGFSRELFDTPKPSLLIKQLQSIVTAKDSIILDFFAGSATTAHAVMQLNAEDGGKRKYICVQLPEPTADDSEAHKAGYKNIADIGKERIRRAAKKIAKEQKQLKLENNTKPDLGFKVFKLARSNFKLWEGDVKKVRKLQEQLLDHINHIEKSATAESILYELLLKSGYPLTTRVKKIKMAKKEVFSVDDGDLLICLDKSLNQEVMDAMADAKPTRVICLDEGFKKNDQLKTNAAHTFKVRAQQEEKEIVFMTV